MDQIDKPSKLQDLFKQWAKDDMRQSIADLYNMLKNYYSAAELKKVVYSDNPLLKSIKKADNSRK